MRKELINYRITVFYVGEIVHRYSMMFFRFIDAFNHASYGDDVCRVDIKREPEEQGVCL
ncbi:hypothetical protein [Nitrosomonas communis]|uniref:Uncharacterized protein n=1 Tax=Nitrosomonas communis TaxID=44574 RepID=A0A1I4RUP4_9PROT|nr:hypothetical protein [Nitrosomonas communis]SFM55958.1 hypothetical protein SAMN05421863_103532 [Nitrosomonas communis]